MTSRHRQEADVRSPLTPLEHAVMCAVWESEPCSVEDVFEIVRRTRKLKETSVRTLLRRLEAKGYLHHRQEGRAYVYRATEPSNSLAARAVRQIIDRFCRGSVEELVTGMIDAKVLTPKEIAQLEEVVRSRRRRERQ